LPGLQRRCLAGSSQFFVEPGGPGLIAEPAEHEDIPPIDLGNFGMVVELGRIASRKEKDRRLDALTALSLCHRQLQAREPGEDRFRLT
jgi:hypothetical protein